MTYLVSNSSSGGMGSFTHRWKKHSQQSRRLGVWASTKRQSEFGIHVLPDALAFWRGFAVTIFKLCQHLWGLEMSATNAADTAEFIGGFAKVSKIVYFVMTLSNR
jgi:hypothetical protein